MTSPSAIRHLPVAIQLVCFDLGRVLIRICDGWEEACGIAGVRYPERLCDAERRQLMVELSLAHEMGRMDADDFDTHTGKLLGVAREDVAAVSSAWLKEPWPNVGALLDRVAAANVATACLSNTNDRHWRMMNGPGNAELPLDKLDHHFTSHTIGVMKPDPAIYAHVEQVTGVEPGRILFFDDLPDNVEAARRRGWQAVRIVPEPDPVTQMTEVLRECGVIGD